MTNLTGVPSFGGGGFAFRQPPDPPEPAVPQVAKTALNGTATYTKGNELPGQNGTKLSYERTTDEASATSARRTSMSEDQSAHTAYDPDLPDDILVGPTPAFQASVLEVELDLRNTIAELAAKRSQSTDEAAIAPATTASRHANEPVPKPTEALSDSSTTSERDAEDSAAINAPINAAVSEDQGPEARVAGPAAVLPTPYEG
ncbi:hypothetical protein [Celeribacter sp. ULVN23_4]